MIFRKVFTLGFFLFFFALINASASQINDGFIRLVLNEKNGSFSLYYLSGSARDPASGRYLPLFNNRQPAASYLTISRDGRYYRPGKSRAFSTKIEMHEGNPAIVFESSFLKVTEVFTPVRTTSSRHVNGVRVDIIIENKTHLESMVGLRFLLDTHLAEGRNATHFLTNNQLITEETVIDPHLGDMFWISRGQSVSLMGSIVNPVNPYQRAPDYVIFANWKRLNDTRWELKHKEERTFNNIPYSIADSAVCYFYQPEMLHGGESFYYSIYLTTEDRRFYENISYIPQTSPQASSQVPQEVPQESLEEITEDNNFNIVFLEEEAREEAFESFEETEIIMLIKLQDTLNQFLDGDLNLSESDLAEIEESLNRLKEEL